MVSSEVQSFTSRFLNAAGERLESIISYTHPFSNGGLLIVPTDDAGFIPDLLAQIYACQPPPVTLHCLRRAELFQLSTPGLFGWPRPVEERPHLSYWLKHKGVVLHGRDIRDEISLPDDPSSFVELHVQRVRHCVRNWSFDQLWLKKYKVMVKELEDQARYLMGTALLSRGEWELSREVIPGRFKQVFDDNRAGEPWAQMDELARRLDGMDDAEARASALEALWLFEQFIARLEDGGNGRHT